MLVITGKNLFEGLFTCSGTEGALFAAKENE